MPYLLSLPMRYFLLALFFSSVYIIASSQKRKLRFDLEVFNPSNFKPLTVEIETKKNPSLQTHFKTVIIQDFRADKSKLGFVRAGERNENHRFVFPEKDEEYLVKKINKLFLSNPDSHDTLVLSIKNLWLFQTQQQAGALKRELLGDIETISHCFINYDIYTYKNGIATCLGNIDTIISTKGWIGNESNYLLKKTWLTSITMCDSLFQKQPTTDNLSSVKSNFNFPILATENPTKGIYFSYQDFLNNNPDTVSFGTQIKATKRIVKSTTYPDSIIAKCWGYTDETGTYMNIDNDYYRLNRSQNTFDIRGPYLVDIKNSTFSKIFRTTTFYFFIDKPLIDPSEFIKPRNEKLELFKYYQLDIYTGALR